MRRLLATLFGISLFVMARPATAADMKEWTFMIFLNGHNNLDSFGAINLNQLETVGSTKDINIVVQWASSAAEKTKRLYVQKDADKNTVTSPVIEELPRVDMGDWKQVVEFTKWTTERYPAKHYMFAYWNHGSGWHRNSRGEVTRDISIDDFSHNRITTQQMGLAAEGMAKIVGHKIDIIGSDACLMAMAEVNSELAPFANVAVSSEELEPGLGWPYDKWLSRWAARPTMSAAEVTTILVDEYVKSFEQRGRSDVTLSSVNLDSTDAMEKSISNLAEQVKKLSTADLAKVKTLIGDTTKFYYEDYVDLGDFLKRLEEAKIATVGREASAAREALKGYVIANKASAKYARATGVSFWLPTSSWTYDNYSKKYAPLRFAQHTGWAGAIEWLLK